MLGVVDQFTQVEDQVHVLEVQAVEFSSEPAADVGNVGDDRADHHVAARRRCELQPIVPLQQPRGIIWLVWRLGQERPIHGIEPVQSSIITQNIGGVIQWVRRDRDELNQVLHRAGVDGCLDSCYFFGVKRASGWAACMDEI